MDDDTIGNFTQGEQCWPNHLLHCLTWSPIPTIMDSRCHASGRQASGGKIERALERVVENQNSRLGEEHSLSTAVDESETQERSSLSAPIPLKKCT